MPGPVRGSAGCIRSDLSLHVPEVAPHVWDKQREDDQVENDAHQSHEAREMLLRVLAVPRPLAQARERQVGVSGAFAMVQTDVSRAGRLVAVARCTRMANACVHIGQLHVVGHAEWEW